MTHSSILLQLWKRGAEMRARELADCLRHMLQCTFGICLFLFFGFVDYRM